METPIKKSHWLFATQQDLRHGEESGVRTLENVSLLTTGEALGHGIVIDEVTLDQTVSALKGKKLRSYITHNGALFDDRLTKEVGIFTGISRDGDKVKAAKFKPLKSFVTHNPSQYDALFEMADEMPDDWGISIVPEGYAAWTMKDGSEVQYHYGDDKPDGAIGDMPALRVTKVYSADFVDAPAANAGGLFRADSNENITTNQGDTNMAEQDATKEALALSKQVSDLKDEVTDLKAQLKAKADEIAAIETKNRETLAAVNDEHGTALKADRDRISEILKLGKEHGHDQLAFTALEKGTGVAEFQVELLSQYKSANEQQSADEGTVDYATRRKAEIELQIGRK